MEISQKFKHFNMIWDTDNPENILVDAYDLSYDIDVELLIKYVTEISNRPERLKKVMK